MTAHQLLSLVLNPSINVSVDLGPSYILHRILSDKICDDQFHQIFSDCEYKQLRLGLHRAAIELTAFSDHLPAYLGSLACVRWRCGFA